MYFVFVTEKLQELVRYLAEKLEITPAEVIQRAIELLYAAHQPQIKKSEIDEKTLEYLRNSQNCFNPELGCSELGTRSYKEK